MKKTRTILILIISIVLVISLLINSTYSLITDISSNHITIKDILTKKDNTYNSLYYKLKKELNINNEEMIIIIDSKILNSGLYEAIKKESLSNEELYKLICKYILLENNLSSELQSKIINESNKHIDDINKYLNNKIKKKD